MLSPGVVRWLTSQTGLLEDVLASALSVFDSLFEPSSEFPFSPSGCALTDVEIVMSDHRSKMTLRSTPTVLQSAQ